MFPAFALRRVLLVVLVVGTVGAGLVFGQDPLAELGQLLKSLNYQTGTVSLNGGMATLRVPANYRYLGPEDARKVLVDLWHNPPESGESLGMILPADATPADPECWAAVITWSNDGYIKDDDAANIDYVALLEEMKKAVDEANASRVKEGFGSIELLGWALPPRYEPLTHKLFWAKELKFVGSDEHTLNYNVRMLGRRGALELTAVAGMRQLDAVTKATPELLAMIDFEPGHRYADFDPATDDVAAYGLAALVAGGVAAKAGLFKGLLLAVLAAKKLLIVAALAALVFLRKILAGFFGKSST